MTLPIEVIPTAAMSLPIEVLIFTYWSYQKHKKLKRLPSDGLKVKSCRKISGLFIRP